ncbi:translation release factor [Lithospermum erythrorhizon]|uniref:Translation release factor n=1 Tax=Lithospermum erythrorhizon TaxID=34254 RepID=A0AAV3PK38_LITER
MQVVSKDYVKNDGGSVEMVPEESDDLWSCHNLIAEGDYVLADTVRKVVREGGKKAERMKLRLEIKVERTEYDKQGSTLRILGKNITKNEHVKIGAFHSLQLQLNRPFVLRKQVWDSRALDLLHQASTKNVVDHTKYAHQALTELFTLIRKDSDRACYGPKHVEIAHENMAIQTLLISDHLFRSVDTVTRQRYAKLVSSVKQSGATAFIFSPTQLAHITGIAAILWFPLPDLNHIEM